MIQVVRKIIDFAHAIGNYAVGGDEIVRVDGTALTERQRSIL
jgi:hypothetical protein